MRLIYSILFFIITSNLYSQIYNNKLNNELKQRGEVYISFSIDYVASHKDELSRYSFDKIENNRVYFYADKYIENNIKSDNFPFKLEICPSKRQSVEMAKNVSSFSLYWNKYPTYQQYDSLMHKFEINYPNLCKLYILGTLPSGKQILAVKLGDSVNVDQNEVKFLYTSTMHGDEVTGYVLMLRLIDYLLSNYYTNNDVKYLMDNIEIWINPLANPDGTYHNNDSTVYGATRYNANAIDLNRNYPDPEDGPHSDGHSYQPETVIFMNLADSINFNMSANLHGGQEVANYPWDTWSKLTADDIWWQNIAKKFADTAQSNSPSGYFEMFGIGYTNGYQWYSISGGRQDYMNYFKHCREITLELSNNKIIAENLLNAHWNYLYKSFLGYMRESTFGFYGQTTDSLTGNAVKTKIEIINHDIDSSSVYSNDSGYYFRPISASNYDIKFSANGYKSKTISNFQIYTDSSVVLNVALIKDIAGINDNNNKFNLKIYPNPINEGVLNIKSNIIIENFDIFNLLGKKVFTLSNIHSMNQSIQLNKFTKGVYLLRINYNDSYIVKKFLIQ